MDTLELLAETDGNGTRLRSPEVGLLAGALTRGSILVPGQIAGTIEALGRAWYLVVPESVGGRIVSAPPILARSPVGCGDIVYEVESIGAGSSATPGPFRAGQGDRASSDTGALVLPSPQAGRFYHRPAPGEPAFFEVGAIVEDGQPVGLIEVMKTFSHVPYRAGGSLPRRAKIVRAIAADGTDVKRDDPLLEVEPA
jgi:acetyl-CoA carboxylase biotin carboxyl carrier protein